MNKLEKVKFQFHKRKDNSLDIENFGQFRMGLTGEEIQDYIRARASTLNIERLYKKFHNIAGCNTMGSFHCPDCDEVFQLHIATVRVKEMKNKTIQRQAITTTTKELRKIANELEKEAKENNDKLGVKFSKETDDNMTWVLTIVNKTTASDTWQFEKDEK